MQKPKLSLITASSFVVASMIGTGIFTSLGFQVIDIKTGFAILSLWVIGGIVAFCGAVTYAELGNAFPRSGGEYNLLSKLYHPSLGFVAGWVSATVGFAAPAAIAALALSSYLQPLFPGIWEKHAAALFIMVLGLLHGSSIRFGTTFQNVFTAAKVLLILALIFIGFSMDDPQPITIIPETQSWNEIINSRYAVALVFVMYAYTGWNSSIYVIDEIKQPSANLAKSLFIGTGIVLTLYLLINYIFLRAVPLVELEGQIEIGYIAGMALFGQTGGMIISLIIAFILLSTVSAYVFLGPRILEVMGQDINGLKWLSQKTTAGIPQHAFIFSTLLSLIFIYTSTFDEVLLYTSFLLMLITTLTVGGIFILRFRFGHIQPAYKTFGYPFTPLIFLVISVWTLVYMVIEQFYESMIAVVILAIGVMIYLFTSNNRFRF